jgi:hypothetical protein
MWGYGFTVLLLAALVALCVLLKPRKMMWQASSSGRMYYVRTMPDARLAADRLEELERRSKRMLSIALQKYPNDTRLHRISRNWTGTLAEVEDHKKNVAYSIGKSVIHICVREQHGGVTDINQSMFVLLHELAHVASQYYGHTDEFWTNMKFLLEVAEEAGVYTYVKHDREMYCGRHLGISPLTCVKEFWCDSELGSVSVAPK